MGENALQVVYVNYYTAPVLGESLDSLKAAADELPGLEITLVDNSDDAAEYERLTAMAPESVRLIRSDRNLGFAGACNLGASVGVGKHLLFLNPDTILPAGTLGRIWEELETREGRALIGPRHFADRRMQFAHAPMRGTRFLDEAWDLIYARGWDPGRSLRYLAARGRLIRTKGAVRMRSLSGGCLAMGRAVFDRLGGWDESYWMYGEDVELCVRARRREIDVLYCPAIPLVHFMEASARQLPERVAAARCAGRRRFKGKRYGRAFRALDHWATERIRAWLPGRADPWQRAEALSSSEFEAPTWARRWAIELGFSPLFDNCLTAFPDERTLALPDELLAWLPPGETFVRVAGERAPDQWQEAGLYRISQHSPERTSA